MLRTDFVVAGSLALLGAVLGSACTSRNGAEETDPICKNGVRDGDETGVDCGGHCVAECGVGSDVSSTESSSGDPSRPSNTNGVHDANETDVDCGGIDAPKCGEGKGCKLDSDCEVACNYAGKCISAPSCRPHLGGDTCGFGEVGEFDAKHESCCRSLKVSGFTDPSHPGKTVYLDKYEITAGRIRAFIEQLTREANGVPDVKGWVTQHRPPMWDPAWEEFLPTDYEGGSKVINRRLLGDPRPEDNGWTGPPGPGVILPPPTDEPRFMGTNYQFGSEIYVDLHGNNCGTFPGSYGFPTYYYPPGILALDGQLPRADGKTSTGKPVPAQELLDVKSMNCITNAMLAAFCAWDGGQLATDEVLDYITETPPTLANVSGCGTQIDNHGELLQNVFTHTIQTGGRCAPVALLNATFDAGDNLPVPNSPLNVHNYHYPDTGNQTHDKAWQIAAPGRASFAVGVQNTQVDVVRINPGDEPWMDLNGNVCEAALDVKDGAFSGNFALKYRCVGYGSSRSDLNMTEIRGEPIRRIQRPEAKAAYTGGRCMRFK